MNYNEKIDVQEESLANLDKEILEILLTDNTTKKTIIWATDAYKKHGPGYYFNDYITIEKITGIMKSVIKPRIKKEKQEQEYRIKDKAEVFTPSWMCNHQNNLLDECWFGYKNVFNKEVEQGWITNKNKITFNNKKWSDYIEKNILEISCGEAPYLVSRYDTVTGKILELTDRIGMLDRKLRIINENITEHEEWIIWVKKAFKSTFGYEWQGDSVLIARENLLYTFTDNYKSKFNKEPNINLIKEIAEIISWNIWQMDGIKYVIPNSCKTEKIVEYTIFGEVESGIECQGCKKNNAHKHNGKYCKIMNWETNRAIKFITLVDRSGKNE